MQRIFKASLFFTVFVLLSIASHTYSANQQNETGSPHRTAQEPAWSSLDLHDGLFFLSSSREETATQLKETRHKAWIQPALSVSFITYRKYLDFFQLSLAHNFLLGHTTGLRAPPIC